jgi:hypothetical protein
MLHTLRWIAALSSITRNTISLTGTTVGLALVAALVATWDVIHSGPWPLLVMALAVLLIAITLIVFAVLIYLYAVPAPGIFSNRLLRWYSQPMRKVSWHFDNFLGGGSSAGKPIVMRSFQTQIRVNWGRGITPIRAYIECPNTYTRKEVLFEGADPSNRDGYGDVKHIEFIPRGKWFRMMAFFDDDGGGQGLTKDAFFYKFDGFRFVFEYDRTRFERKFSRFEIESVFDSYWRYLNRSDGPQLRRRQEV